ncbi:MAG: YceI family protein [Verrucomicrobiota bacterium]
MTAKDFHSRKPDSVQLLDVRLSDDYEAEHIQVAKNNCVFEMTFASRLVDTAPDQAKTTVVYGASQNSQEASMAAEKLRRLGYKDCHILEGGLESARSSSLPIKKGTPVATVPAVEEGKKSIDLEESKVEWLGRNLINKHWGNAPLESGHLEFSDGALTGGEFVIDLTKLTCSDLEGSEMHDVLIAHLHSDDFFDVERHPQATFRITSVTPTRPHPGSENLQIVGELTLRGITNKIEFPASAGFTPEGKAAAQASFSIDRTRWNVLYGSGKFFQRLAGHLVNDNIEFQLRIVTA